VDSAIEWDLVEGEYTPRSVTEATTQALRRATHRTIKKVLPEIRLIPDTPVVVDLQEFIRLVGHARVAGDVEFSAWEEARDTLLLLLAPAIPGFMEVLWHQLGKPHSIHGQLPLVYDEELALEESPAALPVDWSIQCCDVSHNHR
jgi:leucyl-tRNA synthetase